MIIRARTQPAIRYLERIKRGMSPEALDYVIDRVALESFGNLVRNTPKKWTGQTRKAWKIEHKGPARRRILNQSKVMWFLEHGTKAHGPKRVGTRLFIPLTKKAFLAYGRGVRAKLIYGVDYILSKWVRGITAMKIAEAEKAKAMIRLRSLAVAHLKRLKEANG